MPKLETGELNFGNTSKKTCEISFEIFREGS